MGAEAKGNGRVGAKKNMANACEGRVREAVRASGVEVRAKEAQRS